MGGAVRHRAGRAPARGLRRSRSRCGWAATTARSADEAWIELQIRDIGHHPVLLGPYSRFSWFHPGPILYYLLWLPYRITGSTGASLAIAALTLNAVVVVGIAFVARQRGGLPLVLVTLFLVGLLSAGEGAQFFRDVWNPVITVLPFVLLVLVAWSMACAEAWALPVGVAGGVVPGADPRGVRTRRRSSCWSPGSSGAAITVWRRRTDGHHAERVRSWVRMVVVTAGVGAVLWLPVVVQQVRDEPGNLGTLLRFFREHGREHSYGDAWHVVASATERVARLGARSRRPQHLQRWTRPERFDTHRSVGRRARRRGRVHLAPSEGCVPPRRAPRAHDRGRGRVGEPHRRRHLPVPRHVDVGGGHAHVARDRVVRRPLVADARRVGSPDRPGRARCRRGRSRRRDAS